MSPTLSTQNLLITGASGYIGGTFLKHLINQVLPEHPTLKIFALVRSPSQAESAKVAGAVPVLGGLNDLDGLKAAIVDNSVNIVVHFADPFHVAPSRAMIEALAEVKTKINQEVHFIHTSGAKLFSEHAGITDFSKPISDVGPPSLYEIQKNQQPKVSAMKIAVEHNTGVLEYGDSLGVRSYVVVPPMTYGPGEGFGNKISIQFVEIVKIGRALGQLYQVHQPSSTWPLCHLQDLVSFYLILTREILSSRDPPHGRKQGYYFCENGNFSWEQMCVAIAKRMSSRGALKDTAIKAPSEKDMERIAEVIGQPVEMVYISVAGSCSIRGDNARLLGWKPKYDVEHLMTHIGEEVDFVLQELDAKGK
ncbi:NAD-P-binding protein [Dendrothele bispora CBS 962.96]|uniref:NAD-P-binding protein n=1 Tax=Dendrothele bispora (strain CBS 962.96) TaxID=1314807 RepID=A0A4S8MC08_DENBC|nr:NAD-P-binding protein [Dendrothele bispora CBS 962.96]